MMGALADACLSGGGQVIGVIPKSLAAKEIAHRNLTELRVVESMHERKKLMGDRADAFLALPGGFGTWEEFSEAVTWSQLGLQRKACGLKKTGPGLPRSLSFFSLRYPKVGDILVDWSKN